MNTDAARDIYKEPGHGRMRDAQACNRGLQRVPVRGLAKVLGVVKLYALAHNLMRIAALAPQLIGWGITASKTIARSAEGYGMSEIRPARAYEADLEPTARAPNHKSAATHWITTPQAILIHSTLAWKRKLLGL